MSPRRATNRDVPPESPNPGRSSRAIVAASGVAMVEDLSSPGVTAQCLPEDFSPLFQVCLPYRGAFIWHVGGADVIGDCNQALFVTGGETFTVSQGRPGAFGELIITPALSTLLDVTGAEVSTLRSHPLFRRRSARIGPRTQRLGARLRYGTKGREFDAVTTDELVLALLQAAFQDGSGLRPSSAQTRRLVDRTKQFLDAHVLSPLRLTDIATAVGVSPAYLTDSFRRVEGVPLGRYFKQLRLARALVELPHTNDLTALAFSLGFSSHSHFTSEFRRAFGYTPSHFRALSRRRNTPTWVPNRKVGTRGSTAFQP